MTCFACDSRSRVERRKRAALQIDYFMFLLHEFMTTNRKFIAFKWSFPRTKENAVSCARLGCPIDREAPPTPAPEWTGMFTINQFVDGNFLSFWLFQLKLGSVARDFSARSQSFNSFPISSSPRSKTRWMHWHHIEWENAPERHAGIAFRLGKIIRHGDETFSIRSIPVITQSSDHLHSGIRFQSKNAESCAICIGMRVEKWLFYWKVRRGNR